MQKGVEETDGQTLRPIARLPGTRARLRVGAQGVEGRLADVPDAGGREVGRGPAPLEVLPQADQQLCQEVVLPQEHLRGHVLPRRGADGVLGGRSLPEGVQVQSEEDLPPRVLQGRDLHDGARFGESITSSALQVAFEIANLRSSRDGEYLRYRR